MTNSEVNGDIDSLAASSASKYGTKFKLMTRTDQIHELQTLIRDAETSRSHFKASFEDCFIIYVKFQLILVRGLILLYC